MQTRTRIATAAGLGLVVSAGPGLLLAASAFAAPTPSPSAPVSTPSVISPTVSSVPVTLPARTAAPGRRGGISVPAGNANPASSSNESTALVLGLAGGGVLLVAGGVIVLGARRR